VCLETHQIGAQCSSRVHSGWCKQNRDLELRIKRDLRASSWFFRPQGQRLA
jgi:hypothetical protein